MKDEIELLKLQIRKLELELEVEKERNKVSNPCYMPYYIPQYNPPNCPIVPYYPTIETPTTISFN